MAAEDKKGQTSAEFLLLLGIAIFIVTATVIVSNEQIGTMSGMKEQNDAQNALLDISSAAKDVYSQGAGAKKRVYVNLPPSYDVSNSGIANKSIKISARGTDFASVEDFEVHGSLPSTSGSHWVWVFSEGNTVRIGTAMLSVSKNSVFVLMNANSSTSDSFKVESQWDDQITVTATASWTPTEVSMDVLPATPFTLNQGEDNTIDMSFISSSMAMGYHNGKVVLTADDGLGNQETLNVPVTVEVTLQMGETPPLGPNVSQPPPLTVVPDFWGATIEPDGSDNRNFSVCTNNFTALTSVTFTPSGGMPGDWVGMTTPLGPMGAGTCQDKMMDINVPNSTAPGVYTGYIMVEGQGASDAEDIIELYIVVEESSNFTCLDNQSGYCNCPVGSGYWGVPVCNCIPATIYVLNGTIHGGPDDGKNYTGTLLGGPGTDIIAGTNGSDIIYTDIGGDRVCGHEGDDIIYGDNSGDIIDGGLVDDIIYAGAGADIIYGKDGNDLIYGEQGDD